MPVIIQYLLKLSVSAAVIYAFYYLVLRRLTFYHLNRWYLVGYTLLCFIIPFININPIADKADERMPALNYIPIVQNIKNYMPPVLDQSPGNSFGIWNGIMVLLGIGSAVLLIKLAVQMVSFIRMKRGAKLISDKDSAIYHIDEQIMPFSFGKSIYLNKNMHTDKELGEIIMHEYVHVKQLHSADILIAELFCMLNWYNPFAWFIRHSIRQNLEFIADDQVVRSGIDKKAYQYHLLKVVGIPQYRLANQFNFSSLKKRIIMMNRRRSAKIHLLKFMFILPLLAVTLMAFRSEIINTVNKIAPKPTLLKAVNNSMLPTNTLNTTLTGKLEKQMVMHNNAREIKRPDTTIKKSMDLTAYFKGEVLKSRQVGNLYMIITRDGDRIDTYSNLTSITVKKGDKIVKGQFIGTVDVDTVTGIPKLKYSMYNGTVMVYDADGSDTTKRAYSVASGYGASYNNKAYVAYPAQMNTFSTASSGNTQVYVVPASKTYNVTGQAPKVYVGTVIYNSDDTTAKGSKNKAYVYQSNSASAEINSRVKAEIDSARKAARNKTTWAIKYATVYDNNPGDELTYTIDTRHIDASQFANMEKQFADNGFKLKINNNGKLHIQVSGSKDNSTSSASATFSPDDLNNSSTYIKVTGDKKTGLVSISTYPSGR